MGGKFERCGFFCLACDDDDGGDGDEGRRDASYPRVDVMRRLLGLGFWFGEVFGALWSGLGLSMNSFSMENQAKKEK